MTNREEFEAAYVEHLNESTGKAYRAEDMAALREGTDDSPYGDRAYLNGCWWGWQAALSRSQDVARVAEPSVFEWLETEVKAIDCWHRGDPSYEHDAHWMKDKVLKLIGEAREAFIDLQPPQAAVGDEFVSVPPGLTREEKRQFVLDHAAPAPATPKGMTGCAACTSEPECAWHQMCVNSAIEIAKTVGYALAEMKSEQRAIADKPQDAAVYQSIADNYARDLKPEQRATLSEAQVHAITQAIQRCNSVQAFGAAKSLRALLVANSGGSND
jgi:hypothetical protein